MRNPHHEPVTQPPDRRKDDGGDPWGAGVTLIGYRFGNLAIVRDHLEVTLLAIVGISVLPAMVTVAQERLHPSGDAHIVETGPQS